MQYTQAKQPLALDTPLGPDKLLLTRVRGTEAISQLFHFTLDCLAREPIDFDGLLGQPATVRLSVPGCPTRHINGVVTALSQANPVQGPAGGITFYRYAAELSPRLWLAGLKRQSRVFQAKSVPDILRQILRDEWGFAAQQRLSGTYPARDYCVQYRETDLDFVRRLMEEEGISFFFKHEDKNHTLLLADGPDGYPDLPEQSTLLFDAATGGRRPEGRVTAWAKRQQLRTSKVTLRDHCFQIPESTLQASSSLQDKAEVGKKQHTLRHGVSNGGGDLLEQYDHLAGYAWRFDGVGPDGSDQPEMIQKLYKENQRVADLRMQAEAASALTIDGQSQCGHLLPGCKVTLQRHFDADGGYLLTSVEHDADLREAYVSESEAGLLYENRFRAMPVSIPFRPQRETPKPRVQGVLTAQVVGPQGGEIFVDKYGRVKVKFYWDREQPTGAMNSCWLRVSQVWAGNRWGAFFWPRVGHEVVVGFVEGDPDRPMVVGSVYNETHMPPFELPQNRTLAGVKSNTTASGGNPSDPLQNYSGWVINDSAGKEHIEIHGEKHVAFYAEETERHMVDGPHRLNVNGIHSVHVGSLPGGSGSGGGLDPDNPHPYVYSGYTPGGKVGVAVNSTCGASLSAILGLYGTLTVGDYMNLVVNPAGLVADLGMLIPGGPILAGIIGGLGAPLLGYTNITMGSQTQLAYGTNISVHRGAKAAISESGLWVGGHMETGEQVYALVTGAAMALSAGFSTAGMILANKDSYDTSQGHWVEYLATAGALAGALEVAEAFRASYNQVAKAKEAASAALALAGCADGVEAIADTITSMFEMAPLDFNTAHLIKGNTVEYNDSCRLIGADDAVMVYCGALAGEQTALTLTNMQMALFTGVPQVGPRLQLDAEDEQLAFAIGPEEGGVVLAMTPIRLGMQVGLPAEGSSIIINELGITIQSGPCKIVLTVEGTIQLITPAATLSLAEGVVALTGNEETTITGGSALQFIAENCVIGVTNLTSTAIMNIE